jgi:hypothetical protein
MVVKPVTLRPLVVKLFKYNDPMLAFNAPNDPDIDKLLIPNNETSEPDIPIKSRLFWPGKISK